MSALFVPLFLIGFYPLWCAWRANRRTSLTHALVWSGLAWLAWGATLLEEEGAMALRYLALGMTGCAAVAVLGARRPGVAAWNFVVAGLLVVLLLSLAEGYLLRGGAVQLGGVRTLFLAGTLAVGTLNYLPTRVGAGAVLLGVGCGLHLADVLLGEDQFLRIADTLVFLSPWAAWALCRRRRGATLVDQRWLEFRDRFGLVWGQRLREQFNRSTAHAGLSVELAWSGLRSTGPELDQQTQAECLTILQALMKRFGPPDHAQLDGE